MNGSEKKLLSIEKLIKVSNQCNTAPFIDVQDIKLLSVGNSIDKHPLTNKKLRTKIDTSQFIGAFMHTRGSLQNAFK